jgi:hypothetical protein
MPATENLHKNGSQAGYSITSSASASKVDGTEMPRASEMLLWKARFAEPVCPMLPIRSFLNSTHMAGDSGTGRNSKQGCNSLFRLNLQFKHTIAGCCDTKCGWPIGFDLQCLSCP